MTMRFKKKNKTKTNRKDLTARPATHKENQP